MPQQHDDRRDERRRGEHRVFERAQPEHAPARFALREPGAPQRLPVEREAPAVDEDPNPAATSAAAFGTSSSAPSSAAATSR
jgi:hypothetical protein